MATLTAPRKRGPVAPKVYGQVLTARWRDGGKGDLRAGRHQELVALTCGHEVVKVTAILLSRGTRVLCPQCTRAERDRQMGLPFAPAEVVAWPFTPDSSQG